MELPLDNRPKSDYTGMAILSPISDYLEAAMSELTFSEFIRRYNSLYKANNEIYHRLARHFGLSDTAFWIYPMPSF